MNWRSVYQKYRTTTCRYFALVSLLAVVALCLFFLIRNEYLPNHYFDEASVTAFLREYCDSLKKGDTDALIEHLYPRTREIISVSQLVENHSDLRSCAVQTVYLSAKNLAAVIVWDKIYLNDKKNSESVILLYERGRWYVAID